MNLTVATNWDPELVDQLEKISQVGEIFGVLQKTPVGSGRPYFIVANPTEEEAAEYIQKVHAAGRKFNYLLNGPCMNNMEYDKETHQSLIKHIQWLRDIGVDSVTVSIPYLLEIMKAQFPEIEVRVSVIAHVNSVQRARLFEMLGADSITLDFNINRDLRLLKKIRKATECQLALIVNDGCLYQCPYRYYHYNCLAHSTQPYNPSGGFYIDYCIIRCTIEKYSNPSEIIRSRWIRPEDTYIYEDIGIDTFKISGRRMATKWLLNAAKAYSERKYKGNLFDLLNCVSPGVDPDLHSPQYEAFLEKTRFLRREKLINLGQLYPVKPFIDNNALEGFIDFFRNKNCLSECKDCDYCEQIAEKVIELDLIESKKYISALKELLEDLTTSRLFEDHVETEGQQASGELEWNDESREMFEDVIENIPEMFREIARETVSRKAELNAKERRSPIVDKEDTVKAFMSETPVAFRSQMIANLERKGINTSNYRD